ncbi:twin-arginine translocase subunit TatC [Patescibacteria group bacterium]|jgi:sec-independent protein translocase protein TatC|nr:twin-arginine translocase subunit TatC [Patescibacteria group bacterium]
MAAKVDKIIKDYGPYLNDIWRRIYFIALFFIVIFVIGFFSAGWIIKAFLGAFHLQDVVIAVTSPLQFLEISVDISLFLSILVTAPFTMWQFYAFLKPAVSKAEFRSLFLTLPLSFVLFVLGFAYGFFTLYFGLQMLASLNVSFGLQNIWDISLFLSQLAITAALLGIIFQFPIVMSIFLKFRIIDRTFLIQKRRIAYAFIVVIVSLLPPTDGVSLLIMSVPLVLLYEITILYDRLTNRHRSLEVEKRLEIS